MSEADTFLTVIEKLVAQSAVQTEQLAVLIQQQRDEHRAFLETLEHLNARLDRQAALMAQQTAHLSQLSSNDKVLSEMLVRLGETLARTE